MGGYIIHHELYWSPKKRWGGKTIKLTDLDVYAELPEEIIITPTIHTWSHTGLIISTFTTRAFSGFDNAKPTLNVINGKRSMLSIGRLNRANVKWLYQTTSYVLSTMWAESIQYFDEETDVFVGLPAENDDMSIQD